MMMTVESLCNWLTEKRTEVAYTHELQGLDFRVLVIPPFVCDDGTHISIQASVVDASAYATFEISMDTRETKTNALRKIYQECTEDCVIGWVPIDLIVAEINAHQDVN